ncbi:MAG TPA: TIM barrel protein [Anaerolineales bacterium]|nr:TIM barrel protein [Anaerolineales bacterium]
MTRPDDFAFGTVGSPPSVPPKPGGSVGAIAHLSSMGLTAFELAWVQSVRVTPARCEAIRQAAISAAVSISVHAPYFINLNADRTEWPKARKRLMDAARFGALAGATDIVFHPGSYFGAEPKIVLEKAIPRLRSCVQELKTDGVDVTLRPETMGKSAMLGSVEDVLTMASEVPGVLPCLDFSHLHARPGDGTFNTREEWNDVLRRYRQALGAAALRRLHIHLSGIAYGPKGEREHLMLVESDMDVVALLRSLQSEGCGGRILCESPKQDIDAILLKRAWEYQASLPA